MADIVRIIDGEKIFYDCALGHKECNPVNPCSVHEKFGSIRMDLKKILMQSNLKDLAVQLENGNAVLKTS